MYAGKDFFHISHEGNFSSLQPPAPPLPIIFWYGFIFRIKDKEKYVFVF